MKLPRFEEVRVIDLSSSGIEIFEFMEESKGNPGFVSSTYTVFYTEDESLLNQANRLYHDASLFKDFAQQNLTCVRTLSKIIDDHGVMSNQERAAFNNLMRSRNSKAYNGQLGDCHFLVGNQLAVMPKCPSPSSSVGNDSFSPIAAQLVMLDQFETSGGILDKNCILFSEKATARLMPHLTVALQAQQIHQSPFRKLALGLIHLKKLSYPDLTINLVPGENPTLMVKTGILSVDVSSTSENTMSVKDPFKNAVLEFDSLKETLQFLDSVFRRSWQEKELGHLFL